MKKLLLSIIALALLASCENQSSCGIIKKTIIRFEGSLTICEFVLEDENGDLRTVEVTKGEYIEHGKGDVFCK